MVDRHASHPRVVADLTGPVIRGWLLALALIGALAPQVAASASFALAAHHPGAGLADLRPRRIASARFDSDREIAQNAALRRELALTTELLERRKRELTWTIAVIVLACIAMTLLMSLLISNRRYRRTLQRLAEQDSLTGLPNRRLTAEKATAALAAASGQRPVSIALIDLDHFKSINDRYGHAVGDHVLREFARLAREMLRSTDTLGRWGGEEFLLILPDTTIDAAVATMHRMRTATAEMPQVDAACGLRVSFSAGIASRSGSEQSLDEVIACADTALYEAKRGGRNLVRLDPETHRSAESSVLQRLSGSA
jgi:diguanylate cyclase (GGDEF)-like protein